MWTALLLPALVSVASASPPEQLTICQAAKLATGASGWAYGVASSVDCQAKLEFEPDRRSAAWFESAVLREGLMLIESMRGTDIVRPSKKLEGQLEMLATACGWGSVETRSGPRLRPAPERVSIRRADGGELIWATATPAPADHGRCLLRAVEDARLALPRAPGARTFHFNLATRTGIGRGGSVGGGRLDRSLPPSKPSAEDTRALLRAFRRAERLERPRLRSCFDRATSGGTERPQAELTLEIDDAGRIVKAVVDSGTAPRDVLDCYAHRLRGLTVALPPGVSGGTLVWTVDFASGGQLGGEPDGPSMGEMLD